MSSDCSTLDDRLIKRGTLKVRTHPARASPSARLTGSSRVRFTDDKCARIVLDPRLGAGEAYMDGRIVMERGGVMDCRAGQANNRWEKRGKVWSESRKWEGLSLSRPGGGARMVRNRRRRSQGLRGQMLRNGAIAAWRCSWPHRRRRSRRTIGIKPVELTEPSYSFDTAEQHGIKVSVLAKGFARPFAIEFLPGGDLLIVERGDGPAHAARRDRRQPAARCRAGRGHAAAGRGRSSASACRT